MLRDKSFKNFAHWYIRGLVQGSGNPIANALELPQSWISYQ